MHKVASVLFAAGLSFVAAHAHADDANVVSARVVSFESRETLGRTACQLLATAKVDGHDRRFDVSVDGTRCPSLAPETDAVPMRVLIEPRADGWRDVVIEMDVKDGESRNEKLALVDAGARALLEWISAKPAIVQVAPPSPPQETGRGMRHGGIALVSIGGAGLGVAAITGVVALFDILGHAVACVFSSCGSRDYSGYGIVAATAGGLGVASMIAGAVLLSITPKRSNVSAQLSPAGGSLRVVF